MAEKLNENQILERIKKISGWAYNDKDLHLIKEFNFKDFSEAWGFISRVALIAEQLNHHPDWSNVYNKVCIKLKTHDVNGLSEKDFNFADKIESL